jgi:hypothetical protein
MRKYQILLLLLITLSLVADPVSGQISTNSPLAEADQVFLPLILTPLKPVPLVYAPKFSGDISFSEMAIFWFGQVNPTDNYADVRVGYNADVLNIHVTVFDRRLWYDQFPSAADLTAWDAVSLYLSLDDDIGDAPGPRTFRFDAQLHDWGTEPNWQAAYQGGGSDWITASIPFTTKSGWRGKGLNNAVDDSGWSMSFRIPFTSLGSTNPPSQGTMWNLAVVLHDRDDPDGTPISEKIWPATMVSYRPRTWGQLVFGLPSYTPPSLSSNHVTIIRHGLNGALVVDSHVGGHTTCGGPYAPDFFTGWGNANYTGYTQINVQNQYDVADWPCFSKYYITFPLDAIPIGKAIQAAKLTMFLFGNSGQGWEPPPQPSLIQVMTIQDDWDEGTINWNNAPLAFENISQTWVNPVDSFPDYPGIPYEWDVSKAVAEAYLAGDPLRLVLYTADASIHSGKYFFSSDIAEWNAEGRPTLEVIWGEPY